MSSPRRTRGSSAPGRKNARPQTGRRPAATTPSTRRSTRSTSAAPAEPVAVGRSKFTSRALILLLVLAVLAVSYASSARAWLNQRGENNALRAQIAEQQAAVDGLKQDKRRWNDADYIKMQARMRFGWVLPGEIGYRVIGSDGKVLAGDSATLTAPTEPAEATDPQWWDTAWSSMEEAGKTPEEVAEEQAAEQPDHQPVSKIGGAGSDKQGKQDKQSEQPSSPR